MKIIKYTYRIMEKNYLTILLCEQISVAWENIASGNILYNFKNYHLSNNLHVSEDYLCFDTFR